MRIFNYLYPITSPTALSKILVEVGIFKSESDFRRDVEKGNLKLNYKELKNSDIFITLPDFLEERFLSIQIGDINHFIFSSDK